MATTLKTIVAFVGVAPGAQATLPHGLNINGLAVIPDEVKLSATAAFAHIASTNTDVTVRNDSAGAANCNVLCEYWYSPNRVFLPLQLTPAPFVINSTLGAGALGDQSQIYYVGKHGADTSNGRNISAAFLTFGAAMAVAVAGDSVMCFDGGTYNERITVPIGVNIWAGNATFTSPGGGTSANGCFELNADSHVVAGTVIGADGEAGFTKLDTVGTCWAECNKITTGVGGWAFVNPAFVNEGILQCKAKTVIVSEDGIGVGTVTTVIGHIHVDFEDLYLAGANAIGLATSLVAGATIVGRVTHILELGASAATVAIDCNTGEINIIVQQISADTAWDVAAAGTLRIFYGAVAGAQVGAGVILTSTPV